MRKWKKNKSLVQKKRSEKWHRNNNFFKFVSRIVLPDTPLIAELRSAEEVMRSEILGPSRYFDGFVTSFHIVFTGNRFSVNIVLAVVHGRPIRLDYVFVPSVLNKEEKLRLVTGKDEGGRQFVSYSPDCTAEDVHMFLVNELQPLLRGAGSEFVAFQYFAYLSRAQTWIKEVAFSSKKDDHRAIDLFVSVEIDGVVTRVPVQVKSSRMGQHAHKEDDRKKHIPSIVIPVRPAYHILYRQMLDLLVGYARYGRVLHISV